MKQVLKINFNYKRIDAHSEYLILLWFIFTSPSTTGLNEIYSTRKYIVCTGKYYENNILQYFI